MTRKEVEKVTQLPTQTCAILAITLSRARKLTYYNMNGLSMPSMFSEEHIHHLLPLTFWATDTN
jgi:hypothetical protein